MSSLEQTVVEPPQIDYTARIQVKPKVSKRMMKYVDAAVSYGAGVAFDTIQYFNRFSPTPSFTPKWTEKPLLKSWQKTKPVLGWPRQTDSLCPQCVKEAREAITSADRGRIRRARAAQTAPPYPAVPTRFPRLPERTAHPCAAHTRCHRPRPRG